MNFLRATAVSAMTCALLVTTAGTAYAAPGKPENVAATGGVNSVTVRWDAPSGGKPTGYSVQCADTTGASQGSAAVGKTARAATVKSLVGGLTYSCSVTAKDANGSSQAATAAPVPVIGVPSAPLLNGITPGGGALTLSFSPPTNTGGLPVVEYWATCGSVVTTGSTSPMVVSLPNTSAAVSCSVKARNAVGLSAASNTMSAAPGQTPSTVKITKISSPAAGTLEVAATAKSPTGAPVNSWTATCLGSGGDTISGSASASPVTVTVTATGVYSCTMVAENIYGKSKPSLPFGPVKAVPTLNAPAAPGITWKHSNSGAQVTATYERYPDASSYVVTCVRAKKTVKASSAETSAVFNLVPGVWGCTLAARVGEFVTPASSASETTIAPAAPKVTGAKASLTVARSPGLTSWTAKCTPTSGKALTKKGKGSTISFAKVAAGTYSCTASGNGVTSAGTTAKAK